LLGEQTREHDDLDLVVDRDALPEIRALLEDRGFEAKRDWLPTSLALRHTDGRAVDLHPIDPTEDGGGDQRLNHRSGEDERYHCAAPTTGTIDGRRVRCCTVETQVEPHVGYVPDADDLADMRRPAIRFGVTLPPPYGKTDSPA
jgi:lincosamide nucleotidyltransferase A/C/D/E